MPSRYQPLSLEPTPRSPWLISLANKPQLTGYSSGFMFAMGWWLFIDGIAYNNSHPNPSVLAFEDWVPGITSTIALIIVNLIDRHVLSADDYEYGSDGVAWKARAVAFFGVTLALGSIGGALAILTLKYIIPGVHGDGLYLGQTIALQSFFIFISSMTLWFGRNSTSD